MRLVIVILLAVLLAAPAGAVQTQLDEFSRGLDPFVRSIFWPGLGQIEQGRTGVGAAFAGGALLASLGALKGHLDYHSAAKDFRNAGDSYAEALATGNTDLAYYYYLQLDALSTKADEKYDDRSLWYAGLAAVWVANLVDVWWHSRGGDERVAFLPVTQPGGGGLAVTLSF